MKKIQKHKWENFYIRFQNGDIIDCPYEDSQYALEIVNQQAKHENHVTELKIYTIIFKTNNQIIKIIGDNSSNILGYEQTLVTPSQETTRIIDINQFN